MIALDTNVFIYVLEGNEKFGAASAALLKNNTEQLVASELVYAEVLASSKLSDTNLQTAALSFLDSLGVTWIKVTRQVLLEAANMRRHQPSCKLADAIHLASAITAQAETLVTNDHALVQCKMRGISVRNL